MAPPDEVADQEAHEWARFRPGDDRRARGQGWRKIARALKIPGRTLRRKLQGGQNPPGELSHAIARLAGSSAGAEGGGTT